MNENNKKGGLFKSSEEVVSMFLGLVVVVVVVGLVVNMVQRNKGKIDVPGVVDQKKEEVTGLPTGTTANVEQLKNVGGRYVVKKGDSLWKIALARYGDGNKWKQIAEVNKLITPNRLLVGQVLLVISETVVSDSQTVERRVEAGKEYTVLRGDSLWKIAVWAYADGYRWVDIWKLNRSKLISPDKLGIGMALMIPSGK